MGRVSLGNQPNAFRNRNELKEKEQKLSKMGCQDICNECLELFLVIVTYLAIVFTLLAIIVAGSGFIVAAYGYTKLLDYIKNLDNLADFEEYK